MGTWTIEAPTRRRQPRNRAHRRWRDYELAIHPDVVDCLRRAVESAGDQWNARVVGTDEEYVVVVLTYGPVHGNYPYDARRWVTDVIRETYPGEFDAALELGLFGRTEIVEEKIVLAVRPLGSRHVTDGSCHHHACVARRARRDR